MMLVDGDYLSLCSVSKTICTMRDPPNIQLFGQRIKGRVIKQLLRKSNWVYSLKAGLVNRGERGRTDLV